MNIIDAAIRCIRSVSAKSLAAALLVVGVPGHAQVTTADAPADTRARVTGAWSWTAKCAEDTTSGTFDIGQVKADGSYDGAFRNGNGSIQGRVRGNGIEFTRALPELQQRWIATVAATKMEGTIERPTEVKANCAFTAARGG